MTTVQTITAPAKEWIAALTRLSPAMVGKKPIPILACIHVDPATGTLKGFDYETSAVTMLDEGTGGGAPFLVTYRWLFDAIRSFTGRVKTAPVTVTQDGDKVTVAACGYEVHAEAQKVEDYPEVPDSVGPTLSELPAAELRATLRRVTIAASTDDRLPILNAVQVNAEDGALELYATDRYRLATDHIMGAGSGSASFLIKRSTIKALDRFLVGDTVKIGLDGQNIIIHTEAATFTTIGVDGDYPKIRTLFPENTAASFEFDRAVLLESAKVAERMNEKYSPCHVRMTEAGAEVTFSYGLFGPSKAPTAAGGVVDGDKDEILFALNPHYLVEALEHIPGDQVRISYTSLPKPFLFSPAGIDATKENTVKHLIMPVRMP
jgi:DNA polymerase-3 subunit beta